MRGSFVLGLLICIVNAEDTILGPRGPRPNNQATSRSSCSEEKKWPICTDDDLGSKCPSGCRMQGLIDVQNQQNDDRVRDIRENLESYSKTFQNTHITVNNAVNRMRHTLEGEERFGDTYYRQVDHLNSRLVILQNRINQQIYRINQLRNSILKQFTDITRLEVDIDIKIRACKGSCKKSFVYRIDEENNARLEKHFRSLSSLKIDLIQYRKPSHTFKLKTVTETSNLFKSGLTDGGTYPHFWEHVNTQEFTLEPLTKDTESVNCDQTFCPTPQSNVKIATDAHGGSGIYSEGGIHSSGDEHSAVTKTDSGHGSHSTTYTSHGSVITKTVISKDGEVVKTVTTSVSDTDPSSLWEQIKGQVKGVDLDLTNVESHRTSGTKITTSKSGGQTVHTKSITFGDDLDDISNLGEYTDFSNLEESGPSAAMEGISGSTKTVTVSHATKTQSWSSGGNAKGFVDLQAADEPSVPAGETIADEQPIASK